MSTKCKHTDMLMLPLYAKAPEDIDSRWCQRCGTLEIRNPHYYLDPAMEEWTTMAPLNIVASHLVPSL